MTQQALWACQWALAERFCPDLLVQKDRVRTERRGARKRVEASPWNVRKLEAQMEEIRVDLARFRDLVHRHETQGLTELPAREKWQSLGEKYRAKTPNIWWQRANSLSDELATLSAQRRRSLSRRQFKRDSAGLAMGVKGYMLRETAPEVEETLGPQQLEEQKAKTVASFKEVWGAESVASPIAEQEWFKTHAAEVRANIGASPVQVTLELLHEALRETPAWKAPGLDGIFGFFLKNVPAAHALLVREFANILDNRRTAPLPEWFTTGRTVLIPKNRAKPLLADDNSRPINCLPGIYKLFTKTLERAIAGQLEKVLTDEQKGCRSRVYGAQHQLIIDRVITEAAKVGKQDLAQVWLDMRKAFDSVSHKWILQVLQAYGIDQRVVRTLEQLMGNWRTVLTAEGEEISEAIAIRRGIFQGDSLSPLLFITALNPISWYVRTLEDGVRCPDGRKLNHLLYVDDWKLFAETKAGANRLAAEVKELSASVGLVLNERKCAVAVVSKGNLIKRPPEECELLSQFPVLGSATELTKYLGILQNGTHDDSRNRDRVRDALLERVDLVLKLKGTPHQLISAINGWALGSFKYSVGLVDWSNRQLKNIDIAIRRKLARKGLKGSRSGKKNLYLPRRLGGRGLQSAKTIARAALIRLDNYIDKELPWLASSFPQSSVLKRIKEGATDARHKVGGAESSGEFIKKLHKQNLATLKPLHRGVENAVVGKEGVNAELSRNWLAKENLSPAMESTFFQIKEEQVQTRDVLVNRWKAASGTTQCRFCHKATETLDHLLSGCEALSFTDYKRRHDQVARQVAKAILEKFGVPWKREYWTDKMPSEFKLTRNGKEGRLRWDPKVRTTEKLEHNHPDLIVELPEGPVAIIEFTVCRDLSVVERAKQKEERYQLLAEDMAKGSKAHPAVIPIVVGTRGVVPTRTVAALKTLSKWGFDIPIAKLQKAAVIGSIRTVWKLVKYSG